MSDKPGTILDLDQLIEGTYHVTMGGKRYDFIAWNSLGILAQKRAQRDWNRVLEIDNAEDSESEVELTDELEAEFRTIIERTLKLLAPEAPDLLAAPQHYKTAALTGFFGKCGMEKNASTKAIVSAIIPPKTETPEEVTGETSSPASITTGRKPARRSGSRRRSR